MRVRGCFLFCLAIGVCCGEARIEVTIGHQTQELSGHLVVAISKEEKTEPRFQILETFDSAQAFGVDVEKLAPGAAMVIDAGSVGYPLEHLGDVPEGDYFVQGVFNVYETFRLASGAVVELPPDRGEGQQWNSKPGNPYSRPQKMHLGGGVGPVRLVLDQVIASDGFNADREIEKEGAGRWLRHLDIRSERLSKFWGRDVSLGAWVLLPDGWSEHPAAHYPLIVYQDHFQEGFTAGVGFHTKPRELKTKTGEKRIDYAYKFFQDWTSGRLPRVIILYVQDANPYYDDSYDVNSANLGPYGDAINEDVIAPVEKQFRGIGAGWARATYGGSTGGWESLASQVLYPDFYNGVWSSCPDPVDFHAYQNVDLYKDKNAYFRSGMFGEIPIAEMREPDGSVVAEMEPANRRELVLGTRGRSAEQFDIWQAVFSPAGADGYPKPVYDKKSGAVNAAVVKYWQEHYDLTAILARDWATLGPKLEGKLHLAVGDGDTWYLNNAVHRLEKTLATTQHPHSDATFDYGPGMPHCYTGEPHVPMSISGPTEVQRVLPQMVEQMLRTAPKGADVTSWRY